MTLERSRTAHNRPATVKGVNDMGEIELSRVEAAQEADTKFELCHDVGQVLKIGRDFRDKDRWYGAHYDTVKLLCDTIEYLRDRLKTAEVNAAGMRKLIDEINSLNDEWFDTFSFPNENGQTSIHDSIEDAICKAYKILELVSGCRGVESCS